MKPLWANFSGLILGILLALAGVGYLSTEPGKSGWIIALGALLIGSGLFLAAKYTVRLRRTR
ncbi:hypothetical protein GCM10010448_01230 [Streptomyces glomeratus]|uniref:LPXTG cell wall anchor domain-containing protein n=1 Tax=Streptomyces glomeratus TaxID=284452 RepID=A0ABN3YCQ8_9ACTN